MRGPARGMLAALALLVVGCGQVPAGSDSPGAGTSPTASVSAPAPPTPAVTPPPASPSSVVASETAGPSSPPTASSPSDSGCEAVPARLSLRGAAGRSFAFAPLDDPEAVVVEGRVSGTEAWSTSKPLVVAAFLATTVDGDPEKLTAANRRLVAAALQSSDADAVRSLRRAIPGSPGRAMTAVLRGIGDTTTVAPDSYEGLMPWSLREQVRFMAALADGKVVSPATSAYLLTTMRPIKAHRWGLGTVGATTFKGGWLRAGRVTRQLGLLDSYAVAISTDRGPVVRQSDGESAHVRSMDELAALLEKRLAWEQACGSR